MLEYVSGRKIKYKKHKQNIILPLPPALASVFAAFNDPSLMVIVIGLLLGPRAFHSNFALRIPTLFSRVLSISCSPDPSMWHEFVSRRTHVGAYFCHGLNGFIRNEREGAATSTADGSGRRWCGGSWPLGLLTCRRPQGTETSPELVAVVSFGVVFWSESPRPGLVYAHWGFV